MLPTALTVGNGLTVGGVDGLYKIDLATGDAVKPGDTWQRTTNANFGAGQIMFATGRIPIQAIIASIEADVVTAGATEGD